MITLLAILRSTSPTSIAHKPGFLPRGTSLLSINVSSDVVPFSLMQICLMKSAIAIWRSDVQPSNTFDISILLYLIVSNSDEPD